MPSLAQRRTVLKNRLTVRAFPGTGWTDDELRVRHGLFLPDLFFSFFLSLSLLNVSVRRLSVRWFYVYNKILEFFCTQSLGVQNTHEKENHTRKLNNNTHTHPRLSSDDDDNDDSWYPRRGRRRPRAFDRFLSPFLSCRGERHLSNRTQQSAGAMESPSSFKAFHSAGDVRSGEAKMRYA